MFAFLVKRFFWMIVTVWLVFTVTFFLMYAVPGGPLSGERKLDAEVERNLEKRYNLDKPLYQQYGLSLWRTMKFDFGPSFSLGDMSVNEVIAQGFPVSASLGIFALSFALCVGIPAGLISALKRGTIVDYGVMVNATIGIAIPNFILASILLIIFVFQLNWLPAAGWGSVNQLILPALSLGAPYAAYIARLTRTGMLEVLGQDYIRTAYAKGLSPYTVITRHAFRGAIVPVVSYLGPAVAGILTGSIVVESIFGLPGMGSHFVKAATQRDYTLAMGMVLIYTSLLFLMNTIVDVSYRIIDPRVKF